MPTAELIVLLTYLTLGPASWLGLSLLTCFARRRMNRLRGEIPPLPDDPPPVTVLVPARNEAANIASCVESILRQDYPRFTLRVIDDRSTDGTGVILDRLAAEDSRIEVIHITELPPGWLGKCHALHVGASSVTTPWILFVDSDVQLQPHALSTAMAFALARKYDALSLLSRLMAPTFVEQLILPLAAWMWSALFTVSLTNDDNARKIAAANGQFFLVRTELYRAVGGHQAVKTDITEDVALMRRLKQQGARVRFFSGDHLLATRMHESFAAMRAGWGRIYSGTAQRRPARLILGSLWLILGGLSVYPALVWGILRLFSEVPSRIWLEVALFHLVVITIYTAFVYRWAGQRTWLSLLFPVGATSVILLLGEGVRMCFARRLTWRGTSYNA